MPENSESMQFMLDQYKALSDSFWHNEESGERRVNFLITLATAVIAAIVALVKVEKLELESFLLPSILAVMALLLLGIVTWRRMLMRNRATDEYKRGMEIVRSWFEAKDPALEVYKPFPKSLLHSIDYVPRRSDQSETEHADDILKKLRAEFDPNDELLGDDAKISARKAGKWVVYGQDEGSRSLFWRSRDKYLLRRANDKLVVYKPRRPSWGGLAETVGLMNSVLLGILLVLLVLGWEFLASSTISTLNVGWALLAGLLGIIGAIIGQCLLIIKFYEEYNIHVPIGDSSADDDNIQATAGA